MIVIKKNNLGRLGIFFLLCLVGLKVFAGGDDSLESLLKEAYEKSPIIEAARSRHDASRARVPQAGAWEDPMVGVTLSDLPVENPSLNRTEMTGIEYEIKQRVSTAGKKTLAKKEARLESQAIGEELENTIDYVFWQIREEYYQLYNISQGASILLQNQAVANALVEWAQKRYAAGLTGQQDLLKAQMEYGKITSRLLTLQKDKRSVESKLNSLIGQDSSLSIRTPSYIPVSRLKITSEAAHALAKDNQHLLKARLKKVEAAKASIRLAQLKHFSDLDVGFAYRQRSLIPGDPMAGEDFFSFSVMAPIPIFSGVKQTKEVVEKKAMLKESLAEVKGTEREIESEINTTLAEMRRSLRERDLMESVLLPQARGAFENSKASYQTGKIEFLNLLNDFQSLLDFRMTLLNAETDYHKAEAKLNYLIGNNNTGGRYE